MKSDPIWKADSNGIIKESKVQEQIKADVNTDLKLKYALQRRSLAFDQARLLDYDVFERWTSVLMESYTYAPIEGYQKVSLEQIHRADLELFKYMMRLTRTGIKVVGGVQPMLAAFNEAVKSPEVRLHLQPLQGAKRKADAMDEDKTKKTSTTENEKLKRNHREPSEPSRPSPHFAAKSSWQRSKR